MLCLFISNAGLAAQKDVAVEWRFLPEKSKGIDFLFVIDNSGSMGSMQRQVELAAEKLSKELEVINFRLALLTTEPKDFARTVIDSSSLTIASDLREAVRSLGTNGSPTERHIEAITTFIQGEQFKNFKRLNANLEIIFVTDEDDNQPNMSSTEFVTFMKDRKLKYDISLIAPLTGCRLNRTEAYPNLEQIIGQDPLNILDSCFDRATYEEKLAKMIKSMKAEASDTNLSGLPFQQIELLGDINLDSVSVEYGSQKFIRGDLENGWVFKDSTNQLIFGNKVELSNQPDGTELVIKYSYR